MYFSLICLDIPWQFKDKLTQSDVKRGADSNYSTLSMDDLKDLNIKELASPDGCVMAMWAVGSMLTEALELMKAYGFKQKQIFVWIKTKKKTSEQQTTDNCLSFGMGHLFRQSHEICLIGINNSKIYKKLTNKSQRSVCFSENLKHSQKPEELQDSLDLMFNNQLLDKLELFARRDRPGWICVGNECPSTTGEDIRISISKLIEKNNDPKNIAA